LFGAERVDTHKLIISFQPAVLTEIVRVEGPPSLTGKRTFSVRRVQRPVIPDRADTLNLKMLLESLPAGTLNR
jgi:hypothetical protein